MDDANRSSWSRLIVVLIGENLLFRMLQRWVSALKWQSWMIVYAVSANFIIYHMKI